MPVLLRAALVLPCVLLGAAVCLCTVLLHHYWWGLALGLGATATVMMALPGGWWARLPFAVGWFGLLAVAMPERPEGDYLVSGDASGYVLLGSGVVVLASGFLGVRASRRTAEDSGTDESAT